MKAWLDTNKLIVIILAMFGVVLIWKGQVDKVDLIIGGLLTLLRLKQGKKEE